MDIKYDTMADVMYITVRKGQVAQTIKQDKSLIDVDNEGNVLGIEILDISSSQELIQNLKKNVEKGVPISIERITPVLV